MDMQETDHKLDKEVGVSILHPLCFVFLPQCKAKQWKLGFSITKVSHSLLLFPYSVPTALSSRLQIYINGSLFVLL